MAKNQMTGGQIVKSLINPNTGLSMSQVNQGVDGSFITGIFHFLYPFWLFWQNIFGILMYMGFSDGANTVVVVTCSILLYFPFTQFKKFNLEFGAKQQWIVTRVLFFGVVTALQWCLIYPLIYYPDVTSVVMLILLLALWFWNYKNRPKTKSDGWISGARALPFRQVVALQQTELERFAADPQYPTTTVNFASLDISSVEATTGIMYVGETRSGKSLLMSMTFPCLLNEYVRAIAYDYGGNYLAKFLALGIPESRIVILNPFHRDCYEWLWSLDFKDPARCFSFAQRLFPKAKDATATYFNNYAARVIAEIMMVLNRLARDAGKVPVWGMREVIHFCSAPKRLRQILSVYEDVQEEFEEFFGESNETLMGVMSTFKNNLMPLKPAAQCWYRARQLGNTVSLNEFPETNKILLLGRDEEKGGEAFNFLNGAVVSHIISIIVGKPTTDDTKPANTLFIGDEFQTLGKLDKLVYISTEGGKYGFANFLATQSLKRVKDIYGDDYAALFGSITHRAFLKVTEAETAEMASKSFGDTTRYKTSITGGGSSGYSGGANGTSHSRSSSRSTTTQEVTEPLFTAGRFQSQEKINMKNPSSAMDVICRCGDWNYRLYFTPEVLISHLPPQPTPEQTRKNVNPQDESMMFFQPLDDSELEQLGLSHLMKNPPVGEEQKEVDFDTIDFDVEVVSDNADDDPTYGTYEMFRDTDFDNIDDGEDDEPPLANVSRR